MSAGVGQPVSEKAGVALQTKPCKCVKQLDYGVILNCQSNYLNDS